MDAKQTLNGVDGAACSSDFSMEGVWNSPGAFTIEWVDEDHVKVTKHWREFDDVAILTGGDFETILETLFTRAVVTRNFKTNAERTCADD